MSACFFRWLYIGGGISGKFLSLSVCHFVVSQCVCVVPKKGDKSFLKFYWSSREGLTNVKLFFEAFERGFYSFYRSQLENKSLKYLIYSRVVQNVSTVSSQRNQQRCLFKWFSNCIILFSHQWGDKVTPSIIHFINIFNNLQNKVKCYEIFINLQMMQQWRREPWSMWCFCHPTHGCCQNELTLEYSNLCNHETERTLLCILRWFSMMMIDRHWVK